MAGRLGVATKRTAEAAQGGSWVLFRILTAAMFLTHGYPKLFGENPQAFQGSGMTTLSIADVISLPVPLKINLLFVAGMVELIGGGMILIGLFTCFFALLAALTVLMAYLSPPGLGPHAQSRRAGCILFRRLPDSHYFRFRPVKSGRPACVSTREEADGQDGKHDEFQVICYAASRVSFPIPERILLCCILNYCVSACCAPPSYCSRARAALRTRHSRFL